MSINIYTKRSNENEALYLKRIEEILKEGLFFPKELSEEKKKIVKIAFDEVRKVCKNHNFSLNSLQDDIDTYRIHNEFDFSPTDFDKKTQRSRKFFGFGKGVSKNQSYFNALFFHYDTEYGRDYIRQKMRDKEIVLLGGGHSKITKEFEENSIFPKRIVNIDPFIEKQKGDTDTLLKIDASCVDFIEKMKNNGVYGADEIWALFSVPVYLRDSQKIEQLFVNIDNLLNVNGTLRIWPLSVWADGDELNILKRKEALQKAIEKYSKNYDVTIVDALGYTKLVAQKLKPF